MRPRDLRRLSILRRLDVEVAEKVFGYKVLGLGTITFIEGEWGIHLDSKTKGWACYAEQGPVQLSGEPHGCRCKDMRQRARRKRHPEPWAKRILKGPRLGGHLQACCEAVLPYSSDISDAWKVVDHIQRKFLHTRFSLIGGDAGFTKISVLVAGGDSLLACPWQAGFIGENGYTHDVKALGDTVPEAICKVAVKLMDQIKLVGKKGWM